jgi:hypothetical protein
VSKGVEAKADGHVEGENKDKVNLTGGADQAIKKLEEAQAKVQI